MLQSSACLRQGCARHGPDARVCSVWSGFFRPRWLAAGCLSSKSIVGALWGCPAPAPLAPACTRELDRACGAQPKHPSRACGACLTKAFGTEGSRNTTWPPGCPATLAELHIAYCHDPRLPGLSPAEQERDCSPDGCQDYRCVLRVS